MHRTFHLAIALGAMFLVACGQDQIATPEQVSEAEQGLCVNDTHCDYYTDATFTVQCGYRDMCIFCSSVNQSSGCVTSPYRQCFVMQECGMAPPKEGD